MNVAGSHREHYGALEEIPHGAGDAPRLITGSGGKHPGETNAIVGVDPENTRTSDIPRRSSRNSHLAGVLRGLLRCQFAQSGRDWIGPAQPSCCLLP